LSEIKSAKEQIRTAYTDRFAIFENPTAASRASRAFFYPIRHIQTTLP
jgi:hypothetical protein